MIAAPESERTEKLGTAVRSSFELLPCDLDTTAHHHIGDSIRHLFGVNARMHRLLYHCKGTGTLTSDLRSEADETAPRR